MTVRWLRGDCRVQLATLEPESVQACITSPPFYGLRDYGTKPLVWGGDASHMHEWAVAVRPGQSGGYTAKQSTNPGAYHAPGLVGECICGASQTNLGLEPTPDLFIEHLVEVFRAVRRVLRPDGVLWLNMGDSYAGSGKGPSNSIESDASQIGPSARKKRGLNNLQDTPTEWIPLQRAGPQEHTIGAGRVPGYKPKDLMMLPARVALALQADGWWLRSQIPWLKRNCMPESTTDRPTTSIEYVYLLSKSRRYYWNADAIRSDAKHAGKTVSLGPKSLSRGQATGANIKASGNGLADSDTVGQARNRRNGDWFFESWQGLLLDEQDGPLALIVNPAGFAGAHFATWPTKLVEPMVKASSRSGDTILDPFAGSGTTLMVADRLGREAVGCELSESYSNMGTDRIVGDAPLFVEVVA